MGIPHLEVHGTSIGSYEKFDNYIDTMNKIIMVALAICFIAELGECQGGGGGNPQSCVKTTDCNRGVCYPNTATDDNMGECLRPGEVPCGDDDECLEYSSENTKCFSDTCHVPCDEDTDCPPKGRPGNAVEGECTTDGVCTWSRN